MVRLSYICAPVTATNLNLNERQPLRVSGSPQSPSSVLNPNHYFQFSMLSDLTHNLTCDSLAHKTSSLIFHRVFKVHLGWGDIIIVKRSKNQVKEKELNE